MLRIHPAESRVRKLAQETPGLYIAFDLLVHEHGKLLTGLKLEERRKRLEAFAARYFRNQTRVRLSPAAAELENARRWLRIGVHLWRLQWNGAETAGVW